MEGRKGWVVGVYSAAIEGDSSGVEGQMGIVSVREEEVQCELMIHKVYQNDMIQGIMRS